MEEAETWREFYYRISNGLEEIEKQKNDKIIIVSHGGALTNIISWWLKLPIELLSHTRFSGKPGGITKLYIDYNNFRVLDILSNRSF